MRKSTIKKLEKLVSENKPIGYVTKSSVKNGVLTFSMKSDDLTTKQLAEIWQAMLEAVNIPNF